MFGELTFKEVDQTYRTQSKYRKLLKATICILVSCDDRMNFNIISDIYFFFTATLNQFPGMNCRSLNIDIISGTDDKYGEQYRIDKSIDYQHVILL